MTAPNTSAFVAPWSLRALMFANGVTGLGRASSRKTCRCDLALQTRQCFHCRSGAAAKPPQAKPPRQPTALGGRQLCALGVRRACSARRMVILHDFRDCGGLIRSRPERPARRHCRACGAEGDGDVADVGQRSRDPVSVGNPASSPSTRTVEIPECACESGNRKSFRISRVPLTKPPRHRVPGKKRSCANSPAIR